MEASNLNQGGLYLLHFSEKVSHARHYLGFAESDIGARVAKHRKGQGARLTQVAAERGIGMEVVRIWPGADRNFERKLKNGKKGPKYCPICYPGKNFGREVQESEPIGN
jgi:predicted GIY-YIG superfamily endonuclease